MYCGKENSCPIESVVLSSRRYFEYQKILKQLYKKKNKTNEERKMMEKLEKICADFGCLSTNNIIYEKVDTDVKEILN